jgi:hypothetical protein
MKINHDDFIDRTLYYYKNVIILEVKNSTSLPDLKELVQIQDIIYSIDQIINDVSKSCTHLFLNNHSQAAAVWLEQLRAVEQEDCRLIFNAFPDEYISSFGKDFALSLLWHNRERLLNSASTEQ